MSRIVDELCEEARLEQIEIGVLNMVENDFKDVARIARLLGTTIDVVEEILKKHKIRLNTESH